MEVLRLSVLRSCLGASLGDADGLGETRKRELQVSALKLGLKSASDVVVLEDEKFPDSMTTTWPTDQITKVLSKAFNSTTSNSSKNKNAKKGGSSQTAPTSTINTLLTFDQHGVSSHPNHISLFRGSRAWIADLKAGNPGWRSPVELYTLTSVNILRKYVGFLDAPLSLLIGGLRGVGMSRKWQRQESPGLVFVSGPGDWRKGQDAMISGHASQMVWFRWGWITLGRYMVVNDLKREHIV